MTQRICMQVYKVLDDDFANCPWPIPPSAILLRLPFNEDPAPAPKKPSEGCTPPAKKNRSHRTKGPLQRKASPRKAILPVAVTGLLALSLAVQCVTAATAPFPDVQVEQLPVCSTWNGSSCNEDATVPSVWNVSSCNEDATVPSVPREEDGYCPCALFTLHVNKYSLMCFYSSVSLECQPLQ